MPETLQKLRPDRDLQCYFERPSAIAALSETSANGFTVSGCWRQQFDWAVVEWNRDNVFEHPSLRNLPDGDVSGLTLCYEEERSNCIPIDSTLYPTVDWPYLRVWAEGSDGVERFYQVPLKRYASPAAGAYQGAIAELELTGTLTAGDYIELAWEAEHYNYQVGGGDTPATAVAALAQIITQNSSSVSASASGSRITLTYSANAGANANRIGVYGTVSGARSEVWAPPSVQFSGGQSPSRWRIALDFANLRDKNDTLVPMNKVRKMRWTWSADLQPASFVRGEFVVRVSAWTVTGSGAGYLAAGPGSRRIEDDSEDVEYTGTWTESRGNFSGGSIRETVGTASIRCTYTHGTAHRLYLGTRRTPNAGSISVSVDGATRGYGLSLAGEDLLVRVMVAELGPGAHSIEVSHTADGSRFYFDFLEIAVPSATLPGFPECGNTTLATDWDTDHSIAIAPERTAWLIRTLGFRGRANHYVGALWFYELVRPGHRYAAATVRFNGSPEFSKYTRIRLGPTVIEHLNLIGDTSESVAKCFECLINQGSTGVWARAEGSSLTITARAMGANGNGLAVTVETNSLVFTADGDSVLSQGEDGAWRTDLAAEPRVNRAARDWSRSFYRALRGYGIDVTAAFSMELQHGDDSVEAGIAQRYPDGTAAWLNTPALQTNFSPASTNYWKQVYADMAQVMVEAGGQPYLQFGEVQWWYFPNPSGLPFYDVYTTSSFQARYGRAMRVITSQQSEPSGFVEEMSYLPSLIGQFTDAVMDHVRTTYPSSKFEVLYPPDVNDAPITRIVNLPAAWSPARLECLKTENFTYTGDRNLDKARESIALPASLGFPPGKASHLVGIWEHTAPWMRERQLAEGAGVESVVLFALDQFCLIGYGLPLERGNRRSSFQGA